MDAQKFLNVLVELILYFKEDGEIIYCNEAAIKKLGDRSGEYPKHVSEILPAIFSDQAGESVGTAIEKWMETGEVVESVMYRHNQTCFPVHLRFFHVDSQEGYLCTALDLTKRREAEKKEKKNKVVEQEAARYKNEFISNITHELRTPVNGMLGLTQSLLDTSLTPTQLETVRVIERCCGNMTKIINDLLDFSKLESGKFSLEEKNFVFREFLNKTMAFNVSAVNEKGLKLILRVADDIPVRLVGDELRLTQIINNLISNAVKFTSVGYIAVEISKTMETDDSVELFFMIMDTGIGIARENMDKLFRSFSQVDASITRRFGGTGLGLSICKQLVEMMGGTIKVESEEGKGSNFSFQVILKKAEEREEEKEVVWFPSGKFIYEGNGRYQMDRAATDTETSSAGMDWSGGFNLEEIYRFGTKENLDEIYATLEKMLLCIELENWEKAENFAGVVKNLVSEDNKELKREAFRLELMIRKENREKSMAQYEVLKEMLDGVRANESD